jgi:uncharacterized glyoxalase superfamily protein PhnB
LTTPQSETSTTSRATPNAGVALPRLKQLTPVLIVDAVEPCVKFWTERLGFSVTNEVPGPEGKLVFASVQQGAIEIMYQTRASVLDDQPGAAHDLTGHSVALFITVDNLDEIERSLAGAPVVKPRHQTFYGSTEIYVREPGGNTVGFAQFS